MARTNRRSSTFLRMYNLQAQHLFERVKVAIAMQERVVVFKAESSDQAVDGSAHGVSVAAQDSVVLSGCNGGSGAAVPENVKL